MSGLRFFEFNLHKTRNKPKIRTRRLPALGSDLIALPIRYNYDKG